MSRPIGTDEMLDRIEELETKPSKADVTRWNAQLERYYKNTTGNALYRPKMQPDPTGRYVLAADYFKMLDRIEELEAKLAAKDKMILALAGDKIDLVSELAGVKGKLARAAKCCTVELRNAVMLWRPRPKESAAWEVRNAIIYLLKELDGQADE